MQKGYQNLRVKLESRVAKLNENDLFDFAKQMCNNLENEKRKEFFLKNLKQHLKNNKFKTPKTRGTLFLENILHISCLIRAKCATA